MICIRIGGKDRTTRAAAQEKHRKNMEKPCERNLFLDPSGEKKHSNSLTIHWF